MWALLQLCLMQQQTGRPLGQGGRMSGSRRSGREAKGLASHDFKAEATRDQRKNRVKNRGTVEASTATRSSRAHFFFALALPYGWGRLHK